MNDIRESEVCRVFSHKFGVVQAHRTSSNLLKMNDIRESKVCRVLSHKFGVVQAHRTSSNLLKMNDIRESEVCRVLSHKFVVVQSHKTLHTSLSLPSSPPTQLCHVFSHPTASDPPPRACSVRHNYAWAISSRDGCRISSGWFKHHLNSTHLALPNIIHFEEVR